MAPRSQGKTNEVPVVRGTVDGLTTVKPPRRKRSDTPSLPRELLAAIRENLNTVEWLSNGEEYPSNEDATRDARVYRRDTARMMRIEERDIRTKVWQNTDDLGDDVETFSFGIKLREKDESDDDGDENADVQPDENGDATPDEGDAAPEGDAA